MYAYHRWVEGIVTCYSIGPYKGIKKVVGGFI